MLKCMATQLVMLLSFQLGCLVPLHVALFELVCVELLGISIIKCVLAAGRWLVALHFFEWFIWSCCWSLSLVFFISGPGVIPLKHWQMWSTWEDCQYGAQVWWAYVFWSWSPACNICGCWSPRPLGLWYWGSRKIKEVWKADSYIRSGKVWLQRRGGVAGCEELPLWAWQISASTSE